MLLTVNMELSQREGTAQGNGHYDWSTLGQSTHWMFCFLKTVFQLKDETLFPVLLSMFVNILVVVVDKTAKP